MSNKVIFLDIDGVLNVMSPSRDYYGSLFHDHLVENLRHIVEETGADIVISSTWRMSGLKIMKEMWESRCLPGKVIGVTPWTNDRVRGREIKMYLENNPVDSYVIIDDDVDMLEDQLGNLVRTSGNLDHEDCVDLGYGLTNKCAIRAIEILNKL